MDPGNLQELEYEYGGYYSSLLFQPDYNKVFGDNMYSSGNILEPNSRAPNMCEESAANEFLLSKMEQDSIPKLMETINNSENQLLTENTELQLLATGDFYSNFQNYLTIINNSNSDLDLNLQVVDLLSSPKYNDICATYTQTSQNTSHYFMGEAKHSPSTSSSNKKPSLFGEAITQRKKRPIEPKKHKPSSCPQFKVSKEKQREKVATLQRLVAPYGKTDTASVLTEAIGYIQFLHDQVQTLSVPYMRSSNSKSIRKMKVNSSEEEPSRDLLSRGLCLVPVSRASFFNSYTAGI